jgi:hypothetical protein
LKGEQSNKLLLLRNSPLTPKQGTKANKIKKGR